MTLEECYAAMDGDLEGVRGRLLTDDRIRKFTGIFLQDKSFENLGASLDEGNLAEAFRAAHTMKGISRDLGFIPLYEVSSALADALRPDDAGVPAAMDQVPDLYRATQEAYQRVVDALALL
ncbi:MAG: Hpt domain-containing protein [Eggerthellaceae bacterium]|nr:Hpt domain-containing protein [Eggerthellaceae bacterium]